MRSSSGPWRLSARGALEVTLLLICTATSSAAAQHVEGFAVERFQPAAPGTSWLAHDDLQWPGGLSAGASLTMGYAQHPLHVDMPGGDGRLRIVSNQAFADVALAVTYGHLRLFAGWPSPIYLSGDSGSSGSYSYTAPSVDLAQTPDTIADVRLGVDVLLAGTAHGRFRVGASAQLMVPSGSRADYVTDDTFRGMLRALVAGDHGSLQYAASLGVHIRPLDQTPAPAAARGHELLFGAAAGLRLASGARDAIVLGPEIIGASAFRSFFDAEGTPLEALLGATFLHDRGSDTQVQVKLGTGAALVPHLGAPVWRVVLGVGIVGRAPERAVVSNGAEP